MAGHFGSTSRHPLRRGFTLVELLVVVGIIAILTAMLLPALASARRQSERVVCMAGLRQIGNGFALYANENAGFWPMVELKWIGPDGTVRDKYWCHYISKYLGQSLNEDGTNPKAESVIKDGRSIQWGCPSWSRAAFNTSTGSVAYNNDLNNGYTMNQYPFAPAPPQLVGSVSNLALRNATAFDGSMSSAGWYYKAAQWKDPGNRALVFDNTHALCTASKWPWWVPVTAKMPVKPTALDLASGAGFTPDFNRHGPRQRANKENDLSINMLFCDGHVDLVSARQAYKAIRYQ